MSAMVSRHDDLPSPTFDAGSLMAEVITKGNLANLSPADRASYYVMVCDSVGLNPATKPFDYITLNGKLVLYATKGATDQLRGMHRVSPRILGMEDLDGVYVVTVEATTPDGRADTDIGAVAIKGLQGEARANAMMKAITKAKRRVTLSLFGLNMLDETEIDSVSSARPVSVNVATGEIVDVPAPVAITERSRPVTPTDRLQARPTQPARQAATPNVAPLTAEGKFLRYAESKGWGEDEWRALVASEGVTNDAGEISDAEWGRLTTVLTWAHNVRRALAPSNLDTLYTNIANVGLGESEWLLKELETRRYQMEHVAEGNDGEITDAEYTER